MTSPPFRFLRLAAAGNSISNVNAVLGRAVSFSPTGSGDMGDWCSARMNVMSPDRVIYLKVEN